MCLGENKDYLSPQRRHGGPAAPGPGRAGPLLARRRSARLSAGEDLSCRPLLPEAARGEQREQGDPGPGRLRLHLPHADGNTRPLGMRVVGAGLSGSRCSRLARVRHLFSCVRRCAHAPGWGVPECLSCMPYT